MYSFLLRPKWIISHVLVAVAIIAMVNLSLWQVSRLDEKRTLNEKIAARADQTPLQLPDVLAASGVTNATDGLDAEFRSAMVSGTYVTEDEFTIPSRTFNGAPGRYLVTPLRWSDTQPDVLVLRGFIPQVVDDSTPPIDGVEPPGGTVDLRGWVRMSQLPEGIQSKSAELGNNQFARIDIDRIQTATGRSYLPVYFQLGAQQPETESKVISLVPLPERSEGPHFSYAIQWAIFVLIALIGYPLIIRKVARGQSLRPSARADTRDDDPASGAAPVDVD